jgi:hypothetical protein
VRRVGRAQTKIVTVECKFNCKGADRDAAAKNAANGRRYKGNGKRKSAHGKYAAKMAALQKRQRQTAGNPDPSCQDRRCPPAGGQAHLAKTASRL